MKSRPGHMLPVGAVALSILVSPIQPLLAQEYQDETQTTPSAPDADGRSSVSEEGKTSPVTKETVLSRYGQKADLESEFQMESQGQDSQKSEDNDKKVGRVSMLRVYNPNSGEHFYTASQAERDFLVKAGWHDEGMGWTAPDQGDPVYRLYNPNSGDHHYTLSTEERDDLVKFGWDDEGTGWYSDPQKSTPLYRLYNPNAETGNHHYTVDTNERQFLIGAGWKDEEIGWYGLHTLSNTIRFEKDGYCYSEDGEKHTGVQKLNDKFYYFDPAQDGKKAEFTGLKKTDQNDLIYGNGDGTLYTGLKVIDGKLYCFLTESGKAARNQFRLLPADHNDGTIDFAWFNNEGVKETGHASTAKEQAAFETWAADGKSWFTDSSTGAVIPVREYLMPRLGNDRLNLFMEEALKYEGTPYVWAGKSPQTGFDCSGLVTWSMRAKWGIDVDPMMTNAAKIYSAYCRPVAKGSQKPGDLVFWQGTYGENPNYISHVGIYIGNDWMYCAGDPIGFYPVDSPEKPDGTPAPYLFGRV